MPWDVKKRDCKQKSTGKKGTHVVVKKNRDGSTEQESCHTSDSKAQGARRARYASKNEAALREWIRASLSPGFLAETGSRGFAYEDTIVNALKDVPGLQLGAPAGNNNAISDLGFTFYGVDVASEVKLNHDANLGAISKDTIETFTFDPEDGRFNHTVKSDPTAQAMKDVIDTAMEALNAGNGPDQIRKLTDAVRKPAQPIDLTDEIVLMGQISRIGSLDSSGRTPVVDEFAREWERDPAGMASWITPAMKTDIFFRVIKDEQAKGTASAERVAQIGLSPEHVAAGFKTLSQVSSGLNKTLMNAPVLNPEQIRKIMTRKKGPNGADTDYLITGRNDENSVSGEIHRIGKDVLGLGAPLFEPASGNLEVRLKGGGSATKGKGTYGVQFSTKAEKGSSGLRFNNAEELAAIFANSRIAQTAQPAQSVVQESRLKRAVLKRLLQEAQKNQH